MKNKMKNIIVAAPVIGMLCFIPVMINVLYNDELIENKINSNKNIFSLFVKKDKYLDEYLIEEKERLKNAGYANALKRYNELSNVTFDKTNKKIMFVDEITEDAMNFPDNKLMIDSIRHAGYETHVGSAIISYNAIFLCDDKKIYGQLKHIGKEYVYYIDDSFYGPKSVLLSYYIRSLVDNDIDYEKIEKEYEEIMNMKS